MPIKIDYVPQERQRTAHLARANEIFFGGSAGGGKALDVHTPIPTPSGWTTMGELQPGDHVFAPDGTPCHVVATSEVFFEDTYRVEFSDGSAIVAGSRHQWVTITADEDNYEGGRYRVRTTEEILATLRDDDGFPNHVVALDKKERSILAVTPVDPVPIKCIQVDHPTHCYLAGKGMVPTHNSFFTRYDAVDFCLQCPKLTAVIFRKSYPQLVNNHIRPLQRALPDEVALWNESNKEFRFPHNGSVLIFKHMESLAAMEDIQGWDIHYAAVDEASLLQPEMLRFIRSRMRLGEYRDHLLRLAEKNERMLEYVHRLPRMVLASNPGGPSHDYLKQQYIDPAPPETEFTDEHGIRKIFIPARMTDNKYLDKNYAAQFAEMPEWQRKQLVDGDWDTIPGAFFDCWNNSRVIEPFQIPRHWTRFRSMDWGFRTPFSVGWWAISDGKPIMDKTGELRVYPEGCMIRYRELYGAKKAQRGGWTNVGWRIEPEDLAHRLLDMEAGEDIAYGVADPSCWRSDGGPSVAEKMANSGVIWQRAANDRAQGSAMMYQRIQSGMLLVFDTCDATIRHIPQMQTDDKKPEEYLKGAHDHVVDDVRYACTSRPMVKKLDHSAPRGFALPTMNDLMEGRRGNSEHWL